MSLLNRKYRKHFVNEPLFGSIDYLAHLPTWKEIPEKDRPAVVAIFSRFNRGKQASHDPKKRLL